MSSAYESEKSNYQRYLTNNAGGRSGRDEEIRTTPLFSLAVKHAVDSEPERTVSDDSPISASSASSLSSNGASGFVHRTGLFTHIPTNPTPPTSCGSATGKDIIFPQYGLLGFNIGDDEAISKNEPIFMNVNAPNSTFICGSQGSGKSYTLSAMLENCLLPGIDTGKLCSPVAGVVFHYDVDSSNGVAEVAHLCSRGIPVQVLVSQSNERVLRSAYNKIGERYGNLTVRPLLLRSRDLSIERMNKLMALAEKEGPVPLYIEVVQRILRQMAIQGTTDGFDYAQFRRLLAAENLTKDQTGPMRLRLGLLESFMHADDLPQNQNRPPPAAATQTTSATSTSAQRSVFTLKPGSLTIIDLSDPFIDTSTVCILFDTCLSLIKSSRPTSGLVIALDEAHKFLHSSSSPSAATTFTSRLLTTIREQRHNATRCIISTQEPTLSLSLLDLCSTTIIHRFTSPAWFATIKDHLSGASSMTCKVEEQSEIFRRIVELDVGESLVFSSSSFVGGGIGEGDEGGRPKKLGSGILKMKTRLRGGGDGGMSVLASGGGGGGK